MFRTNYDKVNAAFSFLMDTIRWFAVELNSAQIANTTIFVINMHIFAQYMLGSDSKFETWMPRLEAWDLAEVYNQLALQL